MAKSTTPPVFKLQPELRNAIYELVLAGPHMTILMPFQLPALLRVCKRTRSEASPIFCAQNDFFASLTTANVKPFTQCLGALGPESVKAIGPLTISLDLDAEKELYRTSKVGGGGVTNYPQWFWVDVPRLIKATGVRPQECRSQSR